MTATLLLSILKYVSFAIAGLSTTWGLFKETTSKDDQGRKVLTRAGQVSVILAIVTALLGMFAFALETYLKERSDLEARALSDLRDKEQRETTARQQAEQRLERQLRDAADSARALEQRRHADQIADSLKLDARLLAQKEELSRVREAQHFLLATQPIRSLKFSIKFSGLPPEQIKVVSTGMESVEHLTDAGSGSVGTLSQSEWRLYQQEVLRSRVFYPFLKSTLSEEFSPHGKGSTEGIFLLVDLDGSGSVVLPLGGTDDERFKGYIEDLKGLATRVLSDVAYDVSPAFNRIGGCKMYTIEVARDPWTVMLQGSASGACLNTILHVGGSASLTASLPTAPRLVIVRAGSDGLAFDTDNVTRVNERTPLCWGGPDKANKGQFKVDVALTPNESSQLTVRSVLMAERQSSELRHLISPEDREYVYGVCRNFG